MIYRVLLITVLLPLSLAFGRAGDQYHVLSNDSVIRCTIRYLVIGNYIADFQEFEGAFHIDPEQPETSFIYLKIGLSSIQSKHPDLDEIVKSDQILDVAKYPYAEFRSNRIWIDHQNGECKVAGKMSLHGVTRDISFSFSYAKMGNEKDVDQINAKGSWTLKRKDFKIVWNKIMDIGGIILSNYLKVEWVITGQKVTDRQLPVSSDPTEVSRYSGKH